MFASKTKTLLKSKSLLTFLQRTKESDIKVLCDYNNQSLQRMLFFSVLLLHLEIKGNVVFFICQFASHDLFF